MAVKNLRTANLSPEEYAAVITACSHKDFLTVKEAALYFGVGLYRLRAMANSEIGEAFTGQCGPRQRLISREKFKKFMEEGGMSTTYGIRAEGWRKDKEADD